MIYFWLCVIIVLTVLEISTVNLVSVWFIASAIVSLIFSLFCDNVLIQVGIFVILGVILLLLTRKHLVKILSVKRESTNADRVIGQHAIVTEDISIQSPGEVSVLGKKWTAVSDVNIKKGSTVKVLTIEGVKLRVKEEK